MEGLTIDVFLSTLIPLLLYFIVTLIGALLKDQLNTILKKDTTFRLNRILIGSVCGAFLMLGLESVLITKFTITEIICMAFVLGTVSFDVFVKISKIENIKKFISRCNKIKEVLKAPEDCDDEKINNGDH